LASCVNQIALNAI